MEPTHNKTSIVQTQSVSNSLNENTVQNKAIKLQDNRPSILQKHALQMKNKVNVKDDAGLKIGTAPIQMVHPAFNDFNYWRPNQLNLETGQYEAHPMSPEGKKKDLTNEFGAEVMKLILYTDLPSDEAVERENLTREFYRNGGNPWDAYFLLHKYPLDNQKLQSAFRYYTQKKTGLVTYTSLEATGQVVINLVPGYRIESEDQIHEIIKNFKNIIKGAPQLAVGLHPQLIALNIALKEKLEEEKGPLVFLDGRKTNTGTEVSLFGNHLLYNGKAKACGTHILLGLIGSQFIQSRTPAIKIRININPGVSKAIADTVGNGSFIVININEYQLVEFSVGQLIGLLAHEVGVHSLDSTTLTKQEQDAEKQDKDSQQIGTHGGKQYKIEKQIAAPKQQYDHLTIGRGLLGQVSAAPRLNMYEVTIISIIEALANDNDRKEAAATYCIDIARILVLNDNAEAVANLGHFAKLQLGMDLVHTAVSEWGRMKMKYGKTHPLVNKIDIGSLYITTCLFTLNKLIAKVEKEGV